MKRMNDMSKADLSKRTLNACAVVAALYLLMYYARIGGGDFAGMGWELLLNFAAFFLAGRAVIDNRLTEREKAMKAEKRLILSSFGGAVLCAAVYIALIWAVESIRSSVLYMLSRATGVFAFFAVIAIATKGCGLAIKITIRAVWAAAAEVLFLLVITLLPYCLSGHAGDLVFWDVYELIANLLDACVFMLLLFYVSRPMIDNHIAEEGGQA